MNGFAHDVIGPGLEQAQRLGKIVGLDEGDDRLAGSRLHGADEFGIVGALADEKGISGLQFVRPRGLHPLIEGLGIVFLDRVPLLRE